MKINSNEKKGFSFPVTLTVKMEENLTDAPEALTEEDPRIEPPLSFQTKIVNRMRSSKVHQQSKPTPKCSYAKRSSITLKATRVVNG